MHEIDGIGGGIGFPADDSNTALLRREPNVGYPNVVYSVCTPDRATCYDNTNPSGNMEWEQFKIDTVGPFDRSKMDHLVPAIPAGIWSVNLKGVDLSNLNAYRAQYEIIASPECPPGDACDLKPPSPLLPYLVGDTIWLDSNGNGTQDAGEAGVSGVVINLIDNGTVIGTATTDAQGKYSFQVENGVYTVKVDASNFATGGVLANHTPTVDYSGDNAGDNERSQSVAGNNVLTYDFGYVMKCDTSSAQTLTQGGWSNKAHESKLNGKLPLVIGNNNNSVTLTTRDAVQAFLSSGGPAKQLVGKLTNPGDIKNVLASQTVATTLNYLHWNSLALATLKSGPYAGKTVVQVVNLANQALGSGASKTVLSNLNTALDTINNNMIEGNNDRGNLVCPSR